MERVSEVARLRERLTAVRSAGGRIAFVPTMGNLHDGHLALLRQAQTLADQVVASIFVNPLQFNDPQDFARYPQTLAQDSARLEAEGVTLLFTPRVEEVYPFGMEQGVTVTVPGLSEILCGAHRPGHFAGVATVVTKLFHMVQPDVALFGEKDFQQLQVIRRLVADLALPVEIVAGATVREPDGLAMSSRNGYLTPAERARAPLLYQIVCRARERLGSGRRDGAQIAEIEQDCLQQLEKAGFRPEYCTVRRQSDLLTPAAGERDLVVLAAAWLGHARLIDNVTLE